MDFEKYTDRAKGFVQAAQSLALREGHQQFGPDHLLKVLLDDPEGMAAGLIQRAGGRPGDALAATERGLAKRPKVSGSGAGQVYLAPELARVFDTAEKIADKAGDKFVRLAPLRVATEASECRDGSSSKYLEHGNDFRGLTALRFTGPNRDAMGQGSRSTVKQRFGSGATAS